MFLYYYKLYEDPMCFIRKAINELYAKTLIKRLYKKISMFDKSWYLKSQNQFGCFTHFLKAYLYS